MRQPAGLLRRILGIIIGAGALVLAFVFSLVIFAIALVSVLVVLGLLWWKTRSLRRARADGVIETMEYHEVRAEASGSPAIEGESRREPSRDE